MTDRDREVIRGPVIGYLVAMAALLILLIA
jgi:hypothetical protein